MLYRLTRTHLTPYAVPLAVLGFHERATQTSRRSRRWTKSLIDRLRAPTAPTCSC